MCNSASIWEAGTVYLVAGARAPNALPTSASRLACSILREQQPPGEPPPPRAEETFPKSPSRLGRSRPRGLIRAPRRSA